MTAVEIEPPHVFIETRRLPVRCASCAEQLNRMAGVLSVEPVGMLPGITRLA